MIRLVLFTDNIEDHARRYSNDQDEFLGLVALME